MKTAVLALLAASALLAQSPADLMKNIRFREIGPASMGGRINDVAVVESDPRIVYVATASAGVWRTVNSGTTWEPLFDNQSVHSIGDIAIAPSDPSVIWAGSGESNNRQSSSWGNGVYKSTDGGKTWAHMGLKETHHIGRVVIHPRDPNVVYVAAAGRLWGANEERGVFKTTDGGKNWTKVLFVNADTGVNDLAMDPQSPDTLYAGAYQRRRTAWGFNGGGPGSGLYKSTDGGATWRKLSTGLPEGDMGRIGVNIYRRNPNIVYALIEHARGGIYRSENKGETWVKMSDTNPRPMYYSQVHIDPNNDQREWVLGADMFYSEHGGKTFVTNRVQRIPGDYHALWINPNDSNHMFTGSDGGLHFSFDAGRSWIFTNNAALGQFYEIGVDMQRPYRICGGLQDNNSWCGPSMSFEARGISNDEWFQVGGGDGFYSQMDPEEPWIVYAESQDGNLLRRDLRTHESRSIRPREKPGEARYRFQWNSPLVISKHDRKTLYYGGNFVFKSTDQGNSWKKSSPELTSGMDRDKQPIMGKLPDRTMLSRHDGVQAFPASTTLSESPMRAGIVWAGTDDGNLHVTRDGETWKNVIANVPGVPKGTYVSRVIASKFAEGRAYATFDGHRGDDFNIYIYVTEDFGETWKPITNGIPKSGGVINVIREHTRNQNLLFAGGEFGLYVSLDRGANWFELKNNLPRVPVDDIVVHPRDNDLILGTHGRSIWILDNLSALEQMSPQVMASDVHVFDTRPATMWRLANRRGNTGHLYYLGQNPPYGATVDYWLKSKTEARDLRVEILDKSGKVIRTLQRPSGDAGYNRAVWDLRMERPNPPTEEERRFLEELGGRGGRFGGGGGPLVDPGEYTVRVTAAGKTMSKPVMVEEDPRITWFSPADRQKRTTTISELYQMSKQADAAQRRFNAISNSLRATIEAWNRPGAPALPENVKAAAEDLRKKVNDMRSSFGGGFGFGGGRGGQQQAAIPAIGARRGPGGAEPAGEPLGSAGPPLVFTPPPVGGRINQLLNTLDSFSAAPTDPQMQELALLKTDLAELSAKVDKLAKEDVAKFNRLVQESAMPVIPTGQ